MDNIKSTFFIKECLLKINEKKKLELIKYNKIFQNMLNINIINYRIFSGKYIIYESNTFAKEFSYNDKLLFEGGYLNRKRNGKGKEYNSDGILVFEGEYLNGKRNGKGKEYNSGGIIVFEGEYLNGKRNGKGKEYDNFGVLMFDGEYFNDKRWNGKGYKLNNIIYKIKDGKGYIKEYIYFIF